VKKAEAPLTPLERAVKSQRYLLANQRNEGDTESDDARDARIKLLMEEVAGVDADPKRVLPEFFGTNSAADKWRPVSHNVIGYSVGRICLIEVKSVDFFGAVFQTDLDNAGRYNGMTLDNQFCTDLMLPALKDLFQDDILLKFSG